jgi:hypothetical protein
MLTGIALAVIVLGVVVLLFGRRMLLLGAGAGALLGLAILQFLPGQQEEIVALLLVVGLAIGGAILGVIGKAAAHLVVMAIGFVAGGALVLVGLDALGIDLGLWNFVVASIGGLIVAVLVNKFFDWAVLILAGLVGGALVMSGLQILFPTLDGTIALIIGIVLAVLGIIYQVRKR